MEAAPAGGPITVGYHITGLRRDGTNSLAIWVGWVASARPDDAHCADVDGAGRAGESGRTAGAGGRE